jgi:phage terminase large subunit GpA-like protein
MMTSEVDGAPRWLAPYLRPSPPTVEQIEAHRSRIDTGGHHAAQVLSFCRTRRARGVMAIKGAAGPRPIWPKRASRGGAKGAEQVFIVGVDTAKDAIYARLRITKPGPGFVHFPAADGFDDAYFEQLTAEKVVTRYKQGRPYRVWELKKAGARNEALDTFVYALAALKAMSLRLDRIMAGPVVDPDAGQDVESVVASAVDVSSPGPAMIAAAQVRKPARRSVRSNYMGR